MVLAPRTYGTYDSCAWNISASVLLRRVMKIIEFPDGTSCRHDLSRLWNPEAVRISRLTEMHARVGEDERQSNWADDLKKDRPRREG